MFENGAAVGANAEEWLAALLLSGTWRATSGQRTTSRQEPREGVTILQLWLKKSDRLNAFRYVTCRKTRLSRAKLWKHESLNEMSQKQNNSCLHSPNKLKTASLEQAYGLKKTSNINLFRTVDSTTRTCRTDISSSCSWSSIWTWWLNKNTMVGIPHPPTYIVRGLLATLGCANVDLDVILSGIDISANSIEATVVQFID